MNTPQGFRGPLAQTTEMPGTPKRGTQKNACYNGTSRGGWERTEDKSQDKCKEKKSLKKKKLQEK